MTAVLRPVILSGGAGTRLWPLSTDALPKQFAGIFEKTLFERSLGRLDGVEGVADPVVVTGARHVGLVRDAVDTVGVRVHQIIAEPKGRNTAPAVLAAALVCEPADVLVVLPSDHLIEDEAGFRSAVISAVPHASSGRLVTFGIVPDRPETGFGYIEIGEPAEPGYTIARFKEKPEAEEAKRLSTDGAHLWNSGMFMFGAGVILDEAREHAAGLMATVRASIPDEPGAVTYLLEGFAEAEAISIDHAVMEHTSRGVVIPIDVGWSDVGSYQALWALSRRDADGNALAGDVRVIDVHHSFVHSSGRKVGVVGLDDVAVVETPDAILVVALEHAQTVRDLVRTLDESPSSD